MPKSLRTIFPIYMDPIPNEIDILRFAVTQIRHSFQGQRSIYFKTPNSTASSSTKKKGCLKIYIVIMLGSATFGYFLLNKNMNIIFPSKNTNSVQWMSIINFSGLASAPKRNCILYIFKKIVQVNVFDKRFGEKCSYPNSGISLHEWLSWANATEAFGVTCIFTWQGTRSF